MFLPVPMIEYVQYDGAILGIIIPPGCMAGPDGVQFVTRDDQFLQAGILKWSAGRVVEPHWHPSRTRIVTETQEALFIRKGEVRIEFYDAKEQYVTFRRVGPGTVVLLLSGGHGLRAITDAEVVEIKQGPYDAKLDKIQFLPKDRDND